MRKLKLYLDGCCLNRPFDDITQDKLRFECEAVLAILKSCEEGIWDVVRSDVLDDEIERTTDLVKKLKLIMMCSSTSVRLTLDNEMVKRARELQATADLNSYDALHLACAEQSEADILLTTDKEFLDKAKGSDARVRVANPAIWLMEEMFSD